MIDLATNSQICEAVSLVESKLWTEGRVLLRASGTEPVIRVMVEGRDATLTNQYANDIAEVIAASVES